jgi:transposase
MLKNLEQLAVTVKTYDKLIRELAGTQAFKAQVDRLMEIHCVGILVATAFVAVTGGDMDRFERPRDVGPWSGLAPKQDQSGDGDKQLHITHAGSDIVRTALVECAGVAMMSNANDTDLKLKGLRIAMRGGRIARKKAKVAVARGLAVTMLALLQHPEREYVPLSEDGKKGFERYRAELEYLTMQKASRKEKKVA